MNVLVVNAGSSSVKFQLIDAATGRRLTGGIVEEVEDHRAALERILGELSGQPVDAVGHRVVHGGELFSAPTLIDEPMLAELRTVTPLAPLHNPANLAGIDAARRVWPDVDQVAVFDTAFHATLGPNAYRYAVPESWYTDHGVRRYGFHGTSHAFVARAAAESLGRSVTDLDLITAHLGNGASTAAIARGESIDTSMGLSPLEGLVMGTRSGDVDPAVITHVARASGRPAEQVVDDLNRASGLLGLCGDSDMRRVIARAASGDPSAELALGVFCHRAKRYVGAHLATLGRCDAVVFTGGIGEHAPQVRARVCAGLDGLGLVLDQRRNESNDLIVSTDDSPIALLVVPTDEERAIAELTAAVTANHRG